MPVLAALESEAAELSHSLDLALLAARKAAAHPLSLLCLSCRISHALHGWLLATYKLHKAIHGIELEVMASYALDDIESLTIRTGLSGVADCPAAQASS
jgi:hypothetical protein